MSENLRNNYVFIDSQNLNLSIRSLGWKLDFRRFRRYLWDKYKITKAFLFIGYVPKYQNLYDNLRQSGYILIFKPVLQDQAGNIKGNIDAELVLQAMIEYDNFNQAIIITGDGDFYCLVRYLNRKNKLLKLLVPDAGKYSGLLKRLTPNKIDFMNTLRNKIEHKQNRL
ncbi:MAG: NYN domain-containing protein [Candidatus Komeilibacteria bacterium]|nr:NYN domain-containing protein [Candidatus Komeilibacteria bacterium]